MPFCSNCRKYRSFYDKNFDLEFSVASGQYICPSCKEELKAKEASQLENG